MKQKSVRVDIAGAVNSPVENESSEYYTVRTRTGDMLRVPYDRIPNLIPKDTTPRLAQEKPHNEYGS